MASSSVFPEQVIGLNKTEWEFVVRRSQDTKVLKLGTYDDETFSVYFFWGQLQFTPYCLDIN